MLPQLTHCVSPFCWGCPGKLSLKACYPSFLRFRLAEDGIVLGDVSWQLGLSLFILGMGLGPCMKWDKAAEFFGPTSLFSFSFMPFYSQRAQYYYIWIIFLFNCKFNSSEFLYIKCLEIQERRVSFCRVSNIYIGLKFASKKFFFPSFPIN